MMGMDGGYDGDHGDVGEIDVRESIANDLATLDQAIRSLTSDVRSIGAHVRKLEERILFLESRPKSSADGLRERVQNFSLLDQEDVVSRHPTDEFGGLIVSRHPTDELERPIVNRMQPPFFDLSTDGFFGDE